MANILFTHTSGTYEFQCMTEGTTIVNVAKNSENAAIKVSAGGSVVFGSSVRFNFQRAQSIEVADGGALVVYGRMQGMGTGNVLSKTGAGVLRLAGEVNGIAEICVGRGTVVVDAAASIAKACSVSLDGGGLFLAGGATFESDIVVRGGAAPIGIHGGGTAVLSGALVLNRDTVLGSSPGLQVGMIEITGPVRQAQQVARLTVSGPNPVMLSGSNTYGGGTHVAENSTLYFGAAQAVPSHGTITAEASGYVGAAYILNLQASLIGHLDDEGFRGTLGFDTAAAVITEAIDLSRLCAYQGIGSKSSATISGPITVAPGSPYLFGGGNGVLYIKSNLTGGGAEGVRVQSAFGSPLTVYLQGNNTFPGDVTARYSNIILDSPGALSGHDGVTVADATSAEVKVGAPSRVQFDHAAYVGYTERFSNNFSEFLNRIGAISDPNAIVGIDAADGAGKRVITENIDLSAGFTRTDPYYLGTSSDVAIDGVITPPGGEGQANPLYLTAIRGGNLTVNSSIGGRHVSSLYIGQRTPHDPGTGTVHITNSQNDYTGGTFVLGGMLSVEGSDSLGSGAVTVGAGATFHSLSGITIANRMVLEAGSTLSGGGNHVSPVAAGHGVTLEPSGRGTTGALHFHEGLTLDAGSRINLDLRSASQFDQLCIWNGFQIVGNVNDPIIIKLYSIGGSGPGAYNKFDPTLSYSWRFAYINSGTLPVEGFDPSYFLVDGTEFARWNNVEGGVFGIEMNADGKSLNITFTPVPEPGTYALMGLGIAMLAVFEIRRRRKNRAVSGAPGGGVD
ncbi:hypothetical protein AW736_22015 [Termitidicoccus mucosus]|uniref:Ice-binding protein C-terminal domain-containing protein n=1 Tax=Termitidicoccus mucosus TaxID=1184151 RepID=A0A178IEZ4_9BACT|nr:hypothetical protein AW736_22015 [Opitutaceae bacterium TSB47]